ncbi:hypothetical protein LOK49_LG01G00643 [Camellia lanceoleosa]|uniref:Uncharacterized protein n=1 Tax=Camellia lanceoleosa TaxID=1840588 RepID=A0ACC0J0K0_9ERIC|nr:hypothetical protein LOK49_LG01G00643 [Camellia lanceoleosa]
MDDSHDPLTTDVNNLLMHATKVDPTRDLENPLMRMSTVNTPNRPLPVEEVKNLERKWRKMKLIVIVVNNGHDGKGPPSEKVGVDDNNDGLVGAESDYTTIESRDLDHTIVESENIDCTTVEGEDVKYTIFEIEK